MREIKFRAWDSYLKKMVFEGFHIWGEVTEFDLIKLHCYENPNPDYKHSLQRANDMVFMQYTGLKDKNGKEIYEGDIVEMKIERAEYEGQDEDEWKVWYEKGKVEFSSGCFWINTNGHSINCHFHYNDSHREVIGNIYENPESPKESE